MPLFVYTTVRIIDNKVYEEDGMIYGSNKDEVTRYLSSLSYVVRDMREANGNDIKLARLKAFRASFNQPKTPKIMIPPVKRIKWKYLVLFLIVLFGCLIWRLL